MEEILIPAAIAALGATYYGMRPLIGNWRLILQFIKLYLIYFTNKAPEAIVL